MFSNKLWLNCDVLSNTDHSLFPVILGLWPCQSFLPSATVGFTVPLHHLPVATLTLVTDRNMKMRRLISLACLGHAYCLSWDVLTL